MSLFLVNYSLLIWKNQILTFNMILKRRYFFHNVVTGKRRLWDCISRETKRKWWIMESSEKNLKECCSKSSDFNGINSIHDYIRSSIYCQTIWHLRMEKCFIFGHWVRYSIILASVMEDNYLINYKKLELLLNKLLELFLGKWCKQSTIAIIRKLLIETLNLKTFYS